MKQKLKNQHYLSNIDWINVIYHAIIGATIARFWLEHF